MPLDSDEAFIYDGRLLLGMIKPLANGSAEAFSADSNGRLVYVGKGASRREATDLVHARRARLEGAPTEQAAE